MGSGGEWLTSRPIHFTPFKSSPIANRIKAWGIAETRVKRKTSGFASSQMLIYIILEDITKMLHRSGSSQENCVHYCVNHWRSCGINTQPWSSQCMISKLRPVACYISVNCNLLGISEWMGVKSNDEMPCVCGSVWDSGGAAPFILKLCTRWRWAASLLSPFTTMKIVLDAKQAWQPQSSPLQFGSGIIILPLPEVKQFLSWPARSLVTTERVFTSTILASFKVFTSRVCVCIHQLASKG